MLRPCGKLGGESGKLTPRRLPPCEGFHEMLASPLVNELTNAYPQEQVAPPTFLTPRPPETPPSRRRGPAPVVAEEVRKGSSMSLPPLPLTARERRDGREELGASGSSISSRRSGSRGLQPTPPSKEKKKPPMPKAPSPKEEASSRASSSLGPSRPSSGDQKASEVELEAPELEDVEPKPCQVPQVVEEMEREKELWNEKTLALLSSNPNLSAYASTATAPSSPPSIDATTAEIMSWMPPDAGVDEALTEQPEPDTAEPLDLGDSLIAQAMREAGLNPDQTSFTDLASEPSMVEVPERCGTSRSWRSSSKSWAAQLAKRKKERCNSGRATPCSGRETPDGQP